MTVPAERSSEVIDADAVKIGEAYEQARNSIIESVKYQIECGRLLAEKKASLPHGHWLPWLKENAGVLGFSADRTAQRLMQLTDSNPTPASDLDESTATEISRKTWGHQQSALYSSESVEWYTPEQYLKSVHNVLLEIDLDPASNAHANKTVQAKEYWSEGALEADWFGRVFLNPPYGRHPEYGSLGGAFCEKALAEYTLGNVSEAIILVNSLHSQNWQASLYSYPVCFVDHRIQFISGEGTENKNPTMQNIFIYLGPNKEAFAREFYQHGYVMEPVHADG